MPLQPLLPDDILSSAQTLWDYMHLHQPLQNCDVCIAMGSHDIRTASYAAQLVQDGWAPLLVCSGGSGRLTEGVWKESEALLFSREAQRVGLSEKKILLETRSRNTGENLFFSAELLDASGISFHSVLLVHKPYMERRVWASARKIWPEVDVIVTSPQITFLDYPTQEIPMEQVIHIIVGDFQRVMEYPKKGFAIPQDVTEKEGNAFHHLTAKGYDTHLLKP